MQTYWIYTTAGSREEAETIARALVQEEIAACANIFDGVRSVYRWQGAVHEDAEAVMIAKTTHAHLDRLIARVRELHSYDCPCVVAMPIAAGNPDYLTWIADSVAGA